MSRGRRRTVRGLVILGSILAFLSAVAIWTERQALDTGDWVSTSGRLLQNQTIRTELSDYLVDQLYENVDIRKELEERLPDDLKEFSGPAAGGLRQVAGQGAEKVLETSTAQELWEESNRTAHEQLLAVLEDKKEAVSTEEGRVSLNLGLLLQNLAEQVGIGEDLVEKLPPEAAQIEILRSDELKTAQNIAIAVKGLALLLSILTFAAFGAAIYLSRDGRWVTVLLSGVGLIAAGFAVVVARQIAGGIVVDELVKTESVKPAGEAAWSIGTSLMVSIATTVIVVGVLFAAAGWLASPTPGARAARRFIAPTLRLHVGYVYTGLAILVGLYFLSGPSQGLRSFLTTLIVAGMAAFGVHELRKQTASEHPEATYDDVFGQTKDKVVNAVKDADIPGKVGEQTSKLRLPEVRLPGAGDDGEGSGPGGQAAEAPTATLPVSDEDARLQRLERLGALRDKGILTEEEFAAEKARLLSRDGTP
ncbi:MAG TPA: SHOCT domain-containing protein [Solirubrobacterales bacterium]|nr:SHOCT domain-containing protein [Solirubrobacterales bacterium]